jgi:RNA polymerase sigma-70 factor (ECF subfamily)
MDDDLDAELMLRFVAGDESAFTELVQRHRLQLVGYLYRQTWDRDRAEDLAQEVFARLFEHREQYRPQGRFKTYLYRIATNLWIDTCRREGRRPTALSLDQSQSSDEQQEAPSLQAIDPYRTPQTHFDRSELMAAIQHAIDALPEDQRLVFNLSEGQGLKYSEIAMVLDIPLGTVKSRMHLAVRKLQGLLGGLRRQAD